MSGTPVRLPPPVWDPLVRLTHWGIALALLINGLVLEGGKLPHIWVGYTAAGLLILRFLWGLVGVGPARFTSFPPSISKAKAHVEAMRRGEDKAFPSHNPLGALMVYALWGVLAIVVATGITMAADPFPESENPAVAYEGASDHGDADRDEGEHGDDEHDESAAEEILEETHAFAANLLLVLALAHVGGVAFETRRSGRNLIGAMAWRRPKSRAQ